MYFLRSTGTTVAGMNNLPAITHPPLRDGGQRDD